MVYLALAIAVISMAVAVYCAYSVSHASRSLEESLLDALSDEPGAPSANLPVDAGAAVLSLVSEIKALELAKVAVEDVEYPDEVLEPLTMSDYDEWKAEQERIDAGEAVPYDA
jgi:hypothetical protein